MSDASLLLSHTFKKLPIRRRSMIEIKRVYEEANRKDGFRVLIDRLWPRGKKKSEVKLDEWLKELSPSTELRKQFDHDPSRWEEFKSAYLKELRQPEAKEKLEMLIKLARKMKITLLFGAKDEEHNNAVVLKQLIERKLKGHKKTA